MHVTDINIDQKKTRIEKNHERISAEKPVQYHMWVTVGPFTFLSDRENLCISLASCLKHTNNEISKVNEDISNPVHNYSTRLYGAYKLSKPKILVQVLASPTDFKKYRLD